MNKGTISNLYLGLHSVIIIICVIFNVFIKYVFRVIEEQSEALKKRKIEQLSQKLDIIVAGKKKKLLSKGITG